MTGDRSPSRKAKGLTACDVVNPSPYGSGFYLLLLLAVLPGCLSQPQGLATAPSRHVVHSGHVKLLSDTPLDKHDPLVAELAEVRERATRLLDLPPPDRLVTIYLFPDETAFRRYIDSAFPGLPRRRAYFVGSSSELTVFSHHGERVGEDLRHEYTHGLLHACLDYVPLWLDEGLAEYFEVPRPDAGTPNSDYPGRLGRAVTEGWRPDMSRLEQIEDFAALTARDYQESWAWVHYLLHGSPEGADVLRDYLKACRDYDPRDEPPVDLSRRIAALEPEPEARLMGHVVTLDGPGVIVRASR
ncbi:MAG: hypothetical protein AAF532_06430 [Planctomycetota bacterium]